MLSGILPVKGGTNQENRNHRMMAINAHVQKVCMEEERGGIVDMWFNYVEEIFTRNGIHLTVKGSAVLVCELIRVVDEATGRGGGVLREKTEM